MDGELDALTSFLIRKVLLPLIDPTYRSLSGSVTSRPVHYHIDISDALAMHFLQCRGLSVPALLDRSTRISMNVSPSIDFADHTGGLFAFGFRRTGLRPCGSVPSSKKSEVITWWSLYMK